jgi:hypothetical protein
MQARNKKKEKKQRNKVNKANRKELTSVAESKFQPQNCDDDFTEYD